MHGIIYQISKNPVKQEDYIKELDFYGQETPFDYCSGITDPEKESNAIDSDLMRILPECMFKCNGREITFIGGSEQFFSDWQKALHAEIDSVSPFRLANGNVTNSSYTVKISRTLTNILSASAFFVDIEYNGLGVVESTDFIFECIGRFKAGDKFYIGGVLDYHI